MPSAAGELGQPHAEPSEGAAIATGRPTEAGSAAGSIPSTIGGCVWHGQKSMGSAFGRRSKPGRYLPDAVSTAADTIQSSLGPTAAALAATDKIGEKELRERRHINV